MFQYHNLQNINLYFIYLHVFIYMYYLFHIAISILVEIVINSFSLKRIFTKQRLTIAIQTRTLKYESKLTVHGSRSKIVFKTFCSFLTQTDMTFNGIGVVGLDSLVCLFLFEVTFSFQ